MHKDSWHMMWQITFALVFMCKIIGLTTNGLTNDVTTNLF